MRAVRKITSQRSAALLESLTAETKQPGASDSAPPASEPTDDVTVAKVSVASGKPDDDTSVSQTGNIPQNGDFSLGTFEAVGNTELIVKMASYTLCQKGFLVETRMLLLCPHCSVLREARGHCSQELRNLFFFRMRWAGHIASMVAVWCRWEADTRTDGILSEDVEWIHLAVDRDWLHTLSNA